jgi:DNA-binding response OmpR family regulator
MKEIAAAPQGRTLLVIDDSRAIRQIIIGLLRESRLFETYLEARDGAQGLEVVAKHPVDLILCDLDMPVLDGFGFLGAFRANPAHASIPVLILSATDHGTKRAEGLERGASDYIGKPCEPAELRARVRNYLRLKVLQDELAAANRELGRRVRELEEIAARTAVPRVATPAAAEPPPARRFAAPRGVSPTE